MPIFKKPFISALNSTSLSLYSLNLFDEIINPPYISFIN
ncbi:hypothetical protein BBUWI9123_F0023 (plasmid) [Borreliella burgdorferi WI91-23]|nr:hypothetical protein BBUWI9123_F0023 [Borreliella burgdorferi WI91-23]